jgi:hypothetical protein
MFNFGKSVITATNYSRHSSLPKDWLRFEGLDTGDEVEIELPERGDLLVKAAEGGRG